MGHGRLGLLLGISLLTVGFLAPGAVAGHDQRPGVTYCPAEDVCVHLDESNCIGVCYSYRDYGHGEGDCESSDRFHVEKHSYWVFLRVPGFQWSASVENGCSASNWGEYQRTSSSLYAQTSGGPNDFPVWVGAFWSETDRGGDKECRIVVFYETFVDFLGGAVEDDCEAIGGPGMIVPAPADLVALVPSSPAP